MMWAGLSIGKISGMQIASFFGILVGSTGVFWCVVVDKAIIAIVND